MIFLTVGSMLPFDRLVQAVDVAVGKGLINDTVYAQIGSTAFKPKYFGYIDSLDRVQYMEIFESSKAIISHAGIGTIAMACKFRKPLLVIPRLKKYNEVVNDHQLKTANSFQQDGYILKSEDTIKIEEKINLLTSFIPKIKKNNADVVEQRVKKFLDDHLAVFSR